MVKILDIYTALHFMWERVHLPPATAFSLAASGKDKSSQDCRATAGCGWTTIITVHDNNIIMPCYCSILGCELFVLYQSIISHHNFQYNSILTTTYWRLSYDYSKLSMRDHTRRLMPIKTIHSHQHGVDVALKQTVKGIPFTDNLIFFVGGRQEAEENYNYRIVQHIRFYPSLNAVSKVDHMNVCLTVCVLSSNVASASPEAHGTHLIIVLYSTPK